MKDSYDYSHIRPKDGESLSVWFTRVIEWAISESKGRQGRIRSALHDLERMAREEGKAEGRREVQALMDIETAKLNKRITTLDLSLRGTVSRIDAEAERQAAAKGMRNRAEEKAMNYGCVPNNTSEAIAALKLPDPLWTETVRPK
ncbi:hypothetical protein LB542_21840 [Mesorhizobium sp. BR1-1-9]|uniref:hypothetical protein n=1 Tax=Mesorhizobium sp. BR1-1-9 TaxID=2876646 RepID=UPI001CD15212|nr:hypothetical protein [Mesorhizobium sp. BR1-1-9]MBZ9873477.1 hypothetical protein [Mesorhizobium sp. BR1-1-9]